MNKKYLFACSIAFSLLFSFISLANGSQPISGWPFAVYADPEINPDSGGVNPSGEHYLPFFLETLGIITINRWTNDVQPHGGLYSTKITYLDTTTTLPGAGILWHSTDYLNISGFNLSGATHLSFWARGANGGEKVRFGVGGLGSGYPDSIQPMVLMDTVTLNTTWTQYFIDLSGRDTSAVITGFFCGIDKSLNPSGATFYVDDIYFYNTPMPPLNNMAPIAIPDSIIPNPALQGHPVTFTGHGIDLDGTVVAYNWSSSIDGQLSTQAGFITYSLSPGIHIIYFKVQDNNGVWSDEATTTLTINHNQPPTAIIDSINPNPAPQGHPVTFTGHGEDPDGIIVAYDWSHEVSIDGQTFLFPFVDLDGRPLGNQASFATPTSPALTGTWTVHFKVQDDSGEWSNDAIATFTLTSSKVPAAIIDSISPTINLPGREVTFRGHGRDPDGNSTIVAYSWRSDKDGQLSTQANFTTSSLSLGSHTISFRVQDEWGLWSPEVIRRVTVRQLPTGPSLEEKALNYEKNIQTYHLQQGQIVTKMVDGEFDEQGDSATYTSYYIAAESFRYRATGDEEAYRNVKAGLWALHRMQAITGQPGIVSRFVDENCRPWEKARSFTSKDVYAAVPFAYSVAYPILRENDPLTVPPDDCVQAPTMGVKEMVRQDMFNIGNHFINNNYTFVGKVAPPITQEEHTFSVDLKPSGVHTTEGLLLLHVLKVAYQITGEKQFKDHYDRRKGKIRTKVYWMDSAYNYLLEYFLGDPLADAVRSPGTHQLRWVALYDLLALEEDPIDRSWYQEIMYKSFSYVNEELNSFVNFTHRIHADGSKINSKATTEGIDSLILFPEYEGGYQNSYSCNDDIVKNEFGGCVAFFRLERGKEFDLLFVTRNPIPLDMRPRDASTWQRSPRRLTNGLPDRIFPGVDYLLAYWMGRAYGLFKEPVATTGIITPVTFDEITSTIAAVPSVETPAGTTTVKITPVTLTFSSVTQGGVTSLSTMGNPPTYYDLTTTAIFSGPVIVCVDYTGISFEDESNLELFHFESGAWVNRTISLDTTNNTICASVDSFSLFAIFEQSNQPPIANAGPDQTVNQGSPVTLDGSGSGDPDNDPLTYRWTWSGGSATGVNPTITLPVGSTIIILVVTDGEVDSAPDQVVIAVRDVTPPTTTVTAFPGPNVNGWNNTNITVNLSAVDNDGGTGVKEISYSLSGAQTGGSVVAGSNISVTILAEGVTTLTYFARDNAENQEDPPKRLIVRIDNTPPVVTTSRTPGPNANGWNNTDVAAHFAATDGLSGIQGDSFFDVFFTLEGANQSATRTFTDLAGNSTSATMSGINIDKTPPAITGSQTPGPNPNGWNNTDVTVSFNCLDGLSGVESCSAPMTLTAEGAGQLSTGTAEDKAGNRATATVSGINIDKTPPVISGLPALGCTLWPPNHRLVQVATVAAGDGLSGLEPGSPGVTGTSDEPENGMGDGDLAPDIIITGDSVQLRAERSGTGMGRLYALTASASDLAGNGATATATCTVPHDRR